MNKLLNEEIVGQVREAFQDLVEPVRVLFFTGADCEYCEQTQQLVEEVTGLADRIQLDIHDLQAEPDVAARYRVDKVPGLVIAGQDGDQVIDYGIRYAGIPSGHEFSSLIQDLLLVSQREAGLKPETQAFLDNLEQEVHLQVFVTPNCPYCPNAVILAHRLALASEKVQAEMVESSEFQELVREYQVSGVPDTSINRGAARVVGAVPEEQLVMEIQKALDAGQDR